MKPKSISRFSGLQSIRPLAFVTTLTAFAAGGAFAATYQWNGTTTSAWSTAGNWSPAGSFFGQTITAGPAPTGATFAHRLNVLNGANSVLIYDGSLGTTVYANSAAGLRGLAMSSGTSAPASSFTITGGSFSTFGSNAADVIGNSTTSGTTSVLTVNGGTFIGSGAGTIVNFGGTNNVSTLNIVSGTATLTTLTVSQSGGGSGTVNLDGGTLAANLINKASTGTATFNFNGGTLQARQNQTAFVSGLTAVNVKSSGAIIDTNNFNVTIGNALLEDPASTGGDLTKNGAGTLTLSSPSTVTGDVTVSAGGLGVKAAATSWTPSTFTHSGDTLNFDLGVYNPTNPALIDVATLTLNTTNITVNISGSSIPVSSEIKILEYGTKSGTGSLTLNIASLPTNMVATLGENTVDGYYYLNVTSPSATAFTWAGDVNPDGTGNWDIATSLNWNANAVAYNQPALVTFPNIAAGGTVTVTTDVAPISFDINNASGNPYTFAGTGKITGNTGITKAGTGIATFNGAAHSYTGPVVINAGAIIKQAADVTTGDITVANNSTFALDGGVTDGAGQTITLSGPGATGADYFYLGSALQRGALQGQNGANTWNGNVILTTTSNTRIGVQNGASLAIGGTITESTASASPTFRAGNLGDDITLNGVCSWTGDTIMFSTGGSIILGGNDRLPTGSRIKFTGSATVFDLNGHNQQTIGVSDFNPTITNQGATPSVLTLSPLIATSIGFYGVIIDGAQPISVQKSGDGTSILGGTNTYSGTTTVNSGTLRIDGNQSGATGAVQVNGGTLGGTATIGGAVTVASGGKIAPGTDGTIESLDVTANTAIAGTLACDVSAAATDQLVVTGDLTLTSSTLAINELTPGTPGSYVIATYTGTRTGTLGGTLPSGYSVNYDDINMEVELVIAASGYNTWAGTNAGSQTADLDFDNDGVDNGVEYFMGETGSGFTTSPTSFASKKATWTNGGNIPFGDYGTQYVIQTSTNLATWTNVLSSDPNLNNIAGSVSFTLTGSGKEFVRLSVTPN
jgi:fibronectin-binding autotransporter adhesin